MKKKHGLGWIFKPKYTDLKTRERREVSVWWIQYSVRGKAIRESSHSDKKQDAVRLLKRRLGEMGKGRMVGVDAEKVTFEDLAAMLIDDYQVNQRKSLKLVAGKLENGEWKGGIIAQLRNHFGNMLALDITSDRIMAYKRERLTQVRPATLQNELSALSRMFSLAVQAKKLSEKPHIARLKVSNARQGFFEEAEIQAVLKELPQDIQPMVKFMALTGWRVGEVRPLQWRQVDFQAQTVRLEPGTTKSGEGRTYPFDDYSQLKELLEQQRDHTLKAGEANEQIINHVFHRQGKPIRNFTGAWKRALARAGLKDKRVHDLRRTAVRNSERAGVSRSVGMKLTGHKTEAVYRRYAIVSEADLSQGTSKLAGLHETKPKEMVKKVLRIR